MDLTYFQYSSNAFGVATVLYILAMMAYITYMLVENKAIGYTATVITIMGFLSQTIAFLFRWAAFYYKAPDMGLIRAVPLTNLYESLVFFVWSLILIYLIIEFKYKTRGFGAFVTPVAGIALAFIEMYGISDNISPLVPALQSNWLLVHVFMSFMAYAAFAVAFSTAIMYMVSQSKREDRRTAFWAVAGASFVMFALIAENPQSLPLWITGFVLVIAVDIVLNVEIAQRLLTGSGGSKVKTVLWTVALSLITVLAMGLFIQLVKLQVVKAQEAAEVRGALSQMQGTGGAPAWSAESIKGNVMGTIALLFFFGAALTKYLLLKKDFYMFWTMTTGAFVSLLGAMGIDFLLYRAGSSGRPFTGQSVLFKASFMSDRSAVAVISFIAAFALIYLLWRYGHVLRNLIEKLNVPSDMLSEVTYGSIAFGFPVFTLGGLIFGAIWADQAWGVYWSWDPKETWSLITWFGYAAYLHARYMKGWRGLNVSVLAVISFVLVIFTYLGVNLLLSGLHAYGSG
jgi:cytochrome c-type biogenesis protein CcsB